MISKFSIVIVQVKKVTVLLVSWRRLKILKVSHIMQIKAVSLILLLLIISASLYTRYSFFY
jgi:hypothetical protein